MIPQHDSLILSKPTRPSYLQQIFEGALKAPTCRIAMTGMKNLNPLLRFGPATILSVTFTASFSRAAASTDSRKGGYHTLPLGRIWRRGKGDGDVVRSGRVTQVNEYGAAR